MWRVAVLAGVLLLATGIGLWWRVRNGRITTVDATPTGWEPDLVRQPTLSSLGVDPTAAQVTLLQFSSAFCQPCRATRAVLGEVAAMMPGVQHVEVDAESHLEAVRELDIRRTPTVLFIDPAGRVVKRASGQPRKVDVIAATAPFLPSRPRGETSLPDIGTTGT
jgi:thiol-disulfide isomerase/thioredoxin